MSVIGSNILAGASGQAVGYQVERSLRFNSSDSAYLSRTPASAGNRKTWTWAGWVKRSKLSSNMPIFGTDYLGASYCSLYFDSNNTLFFENYSGGFQARLQTTQVFRDPSAWLHIVVALDTTQATAANRAKIYVNGSEVTALTIATYPSQNTDLLINNNQYHEISQSNSTYTFGGYLADIHFIDGQALTPSSFTEVSATTGQLIPKKYTGTFTGNSFWLQFADNSAATATTLGKDSSGLGNNWTPNNLSVTAGAGNDSLVDTPTSYGTDDSLGGSVRGNYCTLNPLDNGGQTLSNGNLESTWGSASWRASRGTIGVSSGKWYWEGTFTQGSTAGATQIGIAGRISSLTNYVGSGSDGYSYADNANRYNNGTPVSYGASYTTNDVIGVALDLDAGTLVFYKNGVSQGTAYSSLSGTFFPAVDNYNNSKWTLNFGQRAWAYTPPANHRPLVDTLLPAPAVAKPNTVFDTVLWTGNSASSRAITMPDSSNSPDLVWIKDRTVNGNFHNLFDVVRGAGARLVSNNTDAESSNSIYGYLSSFDSNGFTLAKGSTSADNVNQTGSSYVAWTWDAGSSTVTNTQGSITSSVRANASAGFSIVTYTGTGANATIGHGLGVAPSFVVVKSRTTPSTTGHWFCYHSELGNTKAIFLNLTNAAGTSSTYWNNTSPTSTVFSISTEPAINQSTITYVAYCFAPVAGYSSFGSYTGNGSTDGPFVYTGFRPRWILLKRSSHVGGWTIYDAARDTYNVASKYLIPDLSDAEYTFASVDLLSNGFKLRENAVGNNTSGYTIIYAAFAESPFQYARAR